MKQNPAKFWMIFLLLFLAACAQNNDKNTGQVLIDNGERIIAINVQIADDIDEKARGLMFVENLDENEGMLFIFEDESYQTFWMKNTLIPLDMIFIDDGLKIVDIKNAVPCGQDPCLTYASKKPARYVLEANSGFTGENGIAEGNSISLKLENQ